MGTTYFGQAREYGSRAEMLGNVLANQARAEHAVTESCAVAAASGLLLKAEKYFPPGPKLCFTELPGEYLKALVALATGCVRHEFLQLLGMFFRYVHCGGLPGAMAQLHTSQDDYTPGGRVRQFGLVTRFSRPRERGGGIAA